MQGSRKISKPANRPSPGSQLGYKNDYLFRRQPGCSPSVGVTWRVEETGKTRIGQAIAHCGWSNASYARSGEGTLLGQHDNASFPRNVTLHKFLFMCQ